MNYKAYTDINEYMRKPHKDKTFIDREENTIQITEIKQYSWDSYAFYTETGHIFINHRSILIVDMFREILKNDIRSEDFEYSELYKTINHEYIHRILHEIEGYKTCEGYDNIAQRIDLYHSNHNWRDIYRVKIKEKKRAWNAMLKAEGRMFGGYEV
jgi:hypothetical protein